ncbi:MAG: hypothetical protein LAO30_11020 [Acidobacteriia bacterium]|nr:hypothetical protein [Terriglobia bacterium]
MLCPALLFRRWTGGVVVGIAAFSERDRNVLVSGRLIAGGGSVQGAVRQERGGLTLAIIHEEFGISPGSVKVQARAALG